MELLKTRVKLSGKLLKIRDTEKFNFKKRDVYAQQKISIFKNEMFMFSRKF